jgi:hypothetical protein
MKGNRRTPQIEDLTHAVEERHDALELHRLGADVGHPVVAEKEPRHVLTADEVLEIVRRTGRADRCEHDVADRRAHEEPPRGVGD